MSTNPDIPEVPEYRHDYDREEVLDELRGAMDDALEKFADGRIRDAENEKVRIKYLRAYTSAVAEYRRLVADIEEAEHEERIARLESLVDDLGEGD